MLHKLSPRLCQVDAKIAKCNQLQTIDRFSGTKFVEFFCWEPRKLAAKFFLEKNSSTPLRKFNLSENLSGPRLHLTTNYRELLLRFNLLKLPYV